MPVAEFKVVSLVGCRIRTDPCYRILNIAYILGLFLSVSHYSLWQKKASQIFGNCPDCLHYAALWHMRVEGEL